MPKRIVTCVATALMLLTLSLTAIAQHGRTEEKRVTFAKGNSAVVLRGKIPGVLVTHSYILKARKGQTLSVRLTSGNENLTFAVFDAKNFEAIGAEVGRDRTWRDAISSTEEYTVIVSGISAGNYVLTIDLK